MEIEITKNAFFAEKNKSSKKKRKVVDHDFLACEHHSLMISALGKYLEEGTFADKSVSKINCLLVGLGGGALAMHLVKHFPKVSYLFVCYPLVCCCLKRACGNFPIFL